MTIRVGRKLEFAAGNAETRDPAKQHTEGGLLALAGCVRGTAAVATQSDAVSAAVAL